METKKLTWAISISLLLFVLLQTGFICCLHNKCIDNQYLIFAYILTISLLLAAFIWLCIWVSYKLDIDNSKCDEAGKERNSRKELLEKQQLSPDEKAKCLKWEKDKFRLNILKEQCIELIKAAHGLETKEPNNDGKITQKKYKADKKLLNDLLRKIDEIFGKEITDNESTQTEK